MQQRRPDGKTIASASFEGTVRLWDLQGNEIAKFKHEDWVSSVAFSPDGKTIASASVDNTVRLWDLAGNPLVTFQGHESWVNSVVFSPDGKTIASAFDNGNVMLWDSQGNEWLTFQGHKSWVSSVAFSPNSKTIASASDDHTVRLWPVRTLDELLVQACDHLRGYLTSNPTVSDRDRALYGIPPQGVKVYYVSAAVGLHPLHSLPHYGD
jgi:WD40 repeat protein